MPQLSRFSCFRFVQVNYQPYLKDKFYIADHNHFSEFDSVFSLYSAKFSKGDTSNERLMSYGKCARIIQLISSDCSIISPVRNCVGNPKIIRIAFYSRLQESPAIQGCHRNNLLFTVFHHLHIHAAYSFRLPCKDLQSRLVFVCCEKNVKDE